MSQLPIRDFLLMPQSIGKIWELETVSGGKQLGGMDAAARQNKFLAHFTECQACNKNRHGACGSLP
jgi:hypothetical protein